MSERPNDQIGQRLKDISSEVKLYIEKRVELLLLDIGEEFSHMLAQTVQKLTGIFFLLGASVCLLVALAIYLGEVLGNQSLGYVIVSIPLIVAGFSFFLLKPRSLLSQLQSFFENELMNAFQGRDTQDKKPLNLPETTEETNL